MTAEGKIAEHPIFDAPALKRRARPDQRRPGPKHPNYGIPPEQWPDVIRRIEQGESLRRVARNYNVSYQTVWRMVHAPRRQREEDE